MTAWPSLPSIAMLRTLLLLPLAFLLAAAHCEDTSVRVTTERQGDVVRLFAESDNCLEFTITLNPELQNMRAAGPTPVTVDSSSRRRFLLAELRPANPAQAWSYRYRYHWMYGGRGGRPDDTVYALPFAESHYLRQGYRGGYSHQAGTINEFALDWDMPEGTPVLAARSGTVVGIRQDSRSGGASAEYKNCGNYVIVRHVDGTFAEYLHLQPGGVRVALGAKVESGNVLALSGNTGWSTRPHLHFAVFRTIDGSNRESLPVKFRTKDGGVRELTPGAAY